MLGTILVAYDDSAPARRALEQAVHLAQLEGARIVVVAVAELPPWMDGGPASEFLDARERAQHACHLWLWAAEAYAAAHGVPARAEIWAGSLARAMAAAADACQADLVVVGRRSGPRRRMRLTRTAAERLCRRAGRPLLIVSAPGGAAAA